jgi:FtsP/CotA-like multicopper oxidase with cupredoxin domain
MQDEPRRTSPFLMSRRRLLRDGAVLAGGVVTAAVTGSMLGRRVAEAAEGGGHHALPPKGVPRAPWDRNAALIEPEVRAAGNGVLETTLRVDYAYHDIGGYRLSLRTYEGGIPGPTLRARPGDVLRIKLVNDLPPNRDPAPVDMTLPHQFNTTNFHFHGGHVSPAGISDNVFRQMEPGASYDIEIAIPEDHTRGTYWYHPHKHGSADVQLTSGMFGALIVEGDFDDVPEIAAATERVLILNEVLFDYRGQLEIYDTLWPEAVPRCLGVNGQREPVIRMRPGEVQHWRLIDAAHEDNFRIGLEGHALHVIAHDGIRRDRIAQRDDLVIAPGQRADILVKAGPPGTYLLAALPNDQGYPSPIGPLARLVVEGEPLEMSLPADAIGSPPFAAISDGEITNRRRIWLSTDGPENPAAGNYQEFAFLVCGQRFDPDRVDHTIPLGAVEEWTVENHDEDDHVFHIHTNPFQMMAINGEALAEADREWRDTVVVPRNGSIVFRSRFLDFSGKFVLHCHMMNHEELGMMQVVEVVPA